MAQMTPTRRSELLTALLTEQNRPQQIINPWQLLAQLGAQGIRQSKISQLQKKEKNEQDASSNRIADALAAREGTANIRLDNLDGSSELIASPQMRGGQMASRTLNNVQSQMTPQERLAVAQISQEDNKANAPSLAEEIRMRKEADLEIQKANNAAALERTQLQEDMKQAIADKRLENDLTMQEKDALRRESEQIRAIQAEFELEGVKHQNAMKGLEAELAAEGLDLSVEEAKASGWYASALAGEAVISQYLMSENPYVPSINDISLYAKSIDPDTGAATRVQIRRGISQRALNLLDSANMVIDPVVRMRTGAAVRSDEFITTFNSMIPIGEGSQLERKNKNFFRQAMIAQMGIMSGAGRKATEANIASREIPDQVNDDEFSTAAIDSELAKLDEMLMLGADK